MRGRGVGERIGGGEKERERENNEGLAGWVRVQYILQSDQLE